MPVYPGDPSVTIDAAATVESDGYAVSAVECGSHTGTHIDAPSHTEADGRSIDELPIETFAFDAVKADVRGREPRSAIEPSDLPTADAELVVLDTGWDEYWETERYYDHPYLTEAAAEHCVKQEYHVAIDALNVDPTPTENAASEEPDGVPAHHALLGNERLIIENLTGVGELPKRFELLAFPIKLADSDGAPVRAVARC